MTSGGVTVAAEAKKRERFEVVDDPDGGQTIRVLDPSVRVVLDAVESSPFPEVPIETIEALARRLPPVDPEDIPPAADLVIAVLHGLLDAPGVLVALAGRFGEVRTQRGRRGHVEIDGDGNEIVVADERSG